MEQSGRGVSEAGSSPQGNRFENMCHLAQSAQLRRQSGSFQGSRTTEREPQRLDQHARGALGAAPARDGLQPAPGHPRKGCWEGAGS